MPRHWAAGGDLPRHRTTPRGSPGSPPPVDTAIPAAHRHQTDPRHRFRRSPSNVDREQSWMPDRFGGRRSARRRSAPTRPSRAPVRPLRSRWSPSGYRVGASTGRASAAAQQRQDHRKGPSHLTGSPTGTPAGRWTGSPTGTPCAQRPSTHPPTGHRPSSTAGHPRSPTPPNPAPRRPGRRRPRSVTDTTGPPLRESCSHWRRPDFGPELDTRSRKSSASRRPASSVRRPSLRSPQPAVRQPASRAARTTPAGRRRPRVPERRGTTTSGRSSHGDSPHHRRPV